MFIYNKLFIMKKIILIFTLLFLTTSNIQAQEKSYWACMAVTVDNWGQSQFVDALDNFMNSDVGQLMPYTVTLSEVAFTNGDDDSTHQLCFIGENAESFATWGSGPPPSIEGLALFMTIDEYVDFNQIVLGSPLIFDPSNLSNEFTVVWAMDVSDPVTYANAFLEFNNSTTGTFELHEAIIGAKDGVTHYFVARQTNLGSWLKAREGVFESGAVGQFQSAISGSADILFNIGFNLIKSYNTD